METVGMLHQLHLNNYVHLDIKPANIMFRRSAKPKIIQWLLIDFGLAKYINASIGYTTQNKYFGT